MNRLLIFGLGYSGRVVADAAKAIGHDVSGTTRQGLDGSVRFDDAEPAVQSATHLLTTVAPGEGGDPVLARYRTVIEAAPSLRWIGYLSSTAVYGDRGGGWVDEDTPVAPSQARGQLRAVAEDNWARLADQHAVDIFRLGGIYGPGRSAFDSLRSGQARRMNKPGHKFGRIHRDDIAQAVVAAMRQDRVSGLRIFNLVDDEPCESGAVVAEAATLLGVAPPPETTFAEAVPAMSPIARSFWSENRKVANIKTKSALGISWLYPTYREGLRAVLADETGHRLP